MVAFEKGHFVQFFVDLYYVITNKTFTTLTFLRYRVVPARQVPFPVNGTRVPLPVREWDRTRLDNSIPKNDSMRFS